MTLPWGYWIALLAPLCGLVYLWMKYRALSATASFFRRGSAPNPTRALAGAPKPHSGPAGRACARLAPARRARVARLDGRLPRSHLVLAVTS